ncbi:hypothetical protein SAMN02927937_01929 [Paenimyroides aquimaris]|uniref:Uncharacterized protein n=1 Tax=Paenimyroides marinum TaxID=1159016 RepID=A0A1H6LHV4_9FLAO|nr:hypothetical protein [Paenimyroides aquimaris]SEH88147.1 hypothetical protein SAMN02927937_01929 [Paenimyroides aquimaris]
MKQFFVLLLFMGIVTVSCKGDDSNCCPHPDPTNCNKFSVIDETKYSQTDTSNYTITNVVLNGDCLEITIGASGCDPNNWDMNLFVSELIVETNPAQYKTKTELINNEACLAVFQKTVSFDLTTLQMPGANQVQLTIEGWNTPILYQY